MPQWGEVIRARRGALGKSQAQLAQATKLLNQTEISRLERSLLHPTLDLAAAKLEALLRELEWPLVEFLQATGLEVGASLPALDHLEAQLHFVRFRAEGTVVAGAGATETQEQWVSIPLEDLKAVGVQPHNVRVYVVNGDCMVSESVRGMGQNIAPGDRVAVDTGRMPKAGEVVVAWDGLNEVLLIKRFQEEGEHVVFYPARRSLPPVVRRRDDPVSVVGPVVWRGGPFRG